MDNISDEISDILKNAFLKTEYSNCIDNADTLLRVIYTGKFGADYVFRSLVGLTKIIQNKLGKQIDINTVYNAILQHMESLIKDIATVNSNNNAINFVLKKEYITRKVSDITAIPNLIKKVNDNSRLNIIVDFSSPNVAKDMHVGHLRSTIIGDMICRYFEEQGHIVHRINHIGDFGKPFGMIIQYLYEEFPDFEHRTDTITISDLQEFYAKSKKRAEQDPEFDRLASERVLQIQASDPKVVDAWNFIKEVSRRSYNEIYSRLNITLTEVGESYYQNMIPSVVKELGEKNLLRNDNGRLVIDIPKSSVPLTVVKSDGGYTYDTTDLAAIRYRLVDLNADRIYYVVGDAQAEHFQNLFMAASLANWKKPHQQVHHIGFGLILDENGKPFKSRDGGTVKLVSLLDEAIVKAKEVFASKEHTNLTEKEKEASIRSTAYSAIKYYDLSSSRLKNYKFSYDDMLSHKGNTSVYLLYALVRVTQILNNAPQIDFAKVKLEIEHENEHELCIFILQFTETFERVGVDFNIHYLCDYLYKLSTVFHNFFTNCRCIFYGEDRKTIVSINESRLLLCHITKRIMETCFKILNVETIGRM